jgi:hypothetical protein
MNEGTRSGKSTISLLGISAERPTNGLYLLRRNCLLKQVIEGKIKGEMEVTRSRGRRRKKLLDDLKERRGYSHLKEETLDRTMGGIVLEEALDLSSDIILHE